MTETSASLESTGADVDLTELRATVTGPVLGPTDVDVVPELAGFNLAVEHEPVGVVGATGAADVAAAVRWAAARRVPVAVLATGHGDWSHRGALIVNLRRLDSVLVDAEARTATVGGGVKWAGVVEAAAPHGLAGLTGSSTDVGVVGYTLGGGMGPFARRHGLACDLVRRMQVVTGDGTIREVGPAADPALFWALLGGKDVAGIVTEMQFGLVEMPRLYGGGVFYDGADAATVLHAWRAWAPTLSEDTTTSVAILRLPDLEMLPPPLRGRTVAHLRVSHLGSEESGVELMAPMRALATPIMDMVGEMSYPEVDAIHMDPPDPRPSWATGAYLSDVDAGTVDALLAAAGPQHDLPLFMVELRHLDGASSRATAGCVGRGGARFALGVVAPMVPELRDVVPAVGFGVLDALAPWGTGTVPINWASPQTLRACPAGGWAPEDRDRLAEVAHRCDPAGVLAGARHGLTVTVPGPRRPGY